MGFSYKPLWKLLIDNDMTKKEFSEKVGISKSTLSKMGRDEMISMSILDKICTFYKCEIQNIIEHKKEK